MYLEGYRITSGYGNRPQFGDFHAGVDFATPVGTSLPALVDGTIAFEGWITFTPNGRTYRELICILQADGYFIVYGHLSATLVNAGQRVSKGQVIAKSGNSGYTTGPHLHIEKRLGTKHANNPLSAYPPSDITPLLHAYGQARGGADDMTIIVRPVSMLKINMRKPIPLYDIVGNKTLHNSGDYMEITQMTNLVHGKVFWIPVDRANASELMGFWDKDVTDNTSKIHDTQFDPKPGVDPVVLEKAKKYDEAKKLFTI